MSGDWEYGKGWVRLLERGKSSDINNAKQRLYLSAPTIAWHRSWTGPWLPVIFHLVSIHNNHAFSGHLPAMSQVHQLRYLFETIERVRLDGDVVFGDKVEHTLSFVARRDQGAVYSDVTKDKFRKRDRDFRGLQRGRQLALRVANQVD